MHPALGQVLWYEPEDPDAGDFVAMKKGEMLLVGLGRWFLLKHWWCDAQHGRTQKFSLSKLCKCEWSFFVCSVQLERKVQQICSFCALLPFFFDIEVSRSRLWFTSNVYVSIRYHDIIII